MLGAANQQLQHVLAPTRRKNGLLLQYICAWEWSFFSLPHHLQPMPKPLPNFYMYFRCVQTPVWLALRVLASICTASPPWIPHPKKLMDMQRCGLRQYKISLKARLTPPCTPLQLKHLRTGDRRANSRTKCNSIRCNYLYDTVKLVRSKQP